MESVKELPIIDDDHTDEGTVTYEATVIGASPGNDPNMPVRASKFTRRVRFTIPESWRITFGPPVPGAANPGGEYVLRVWEGKDRQRLLLRNVTEFRATHVPIEEWDDETGEWQEQ